MSMKKNEIFVLNETEEKKNRISEPVLIFIVNTLATPFHKERRRLAVSIPITI